MMLTAIFPWISAEILDGSMIQLLRHTLDSICCTDSRFTDDTFGQHHGICNVQLPPQHAHICTNTGTMDSVRHGLKVEAAILRCACVLCACSWLWLSRLAAAKEFAFMEALGVAGFPVPRAIEHNRHAVLMSLVDAVPLVQVSICDLHWVGPLGGAFRVDEREPWGWGSPVN